MQGLSDSRRQHMGRGSVAVVVIAAMLLTTLLGLSLLLTKRVSSPLRPLVHATNSVYTYGQGYVMAGSDGAVYSFGDASFYGSVYTFGHGSAQSWWGYPIVGLADAVNFPYNGYWLVSLNGVVCNFGVDTYAGGSWGYPGNGCWSTLTGVTDIVGIAPTKDDMGYWLIGADGGVFAFGDAAFLGSVYTFGHGSAQSWWGYPIVGVASSPIGSGNSGYWLVSSNGVVCNFGVDTYAGGSWGYPGNGCWTTISGVTNVVGMGPTQDGQGYRLAGKDGGMFAFGDAGFYGSVPPVTLPVPIVSTADSLDGNGYWMTGTDGGVVAYGDGYFAGGMATTTLSGPIVGITATP